MFFIETKIMYRIINIFTSILYKRKNKSIMHTYKRDSFLLYQILNAIRTMRDYK